MKNIYYDPCGHTKIAVSDFKNSHQLCEDIFKSKEEIISGKGKVLKSLKDLR